MLIKHPLVISRVWLQSFDRQSGTICQYVIIEIPHLVNILEPNKFSV